MDIADGAEEDVDAQEEICKVSPALLCLDPQSKYLAVAAGTELLIFNLQ